MIPLSLKNVVEARHSWGRQRHSWRDRDTPRKQRDSWGRQTLLERQRYSWETDTPGGDRDTPGRQRHSWERQRHPGVFEIH